MESQLALYNQFMEMLGKFREAHPGLMAAEDTVRDVVYKDGTLSGKVKRLMALSVALRAGCVPCILGQTMRAIEAGATKAEVLEVISVATVMGGGIAGASMWRVVKVLEELGKW